MIITEISKNYTGLQTFSLKMAIDVFIGLGHPDWSFVYDGSGEDLVSLLILTVAIACLGTSFATVLAIPVTLFSAVNLWPSAPFSRINFSNYFCKSLGARPICWSNGNWCSPNWDAE